MTDRTKGIFAITASAFGFALMAFFGLGDHELAVHLRDLQIQARIDGDAVQTFDLIILTLGVFRSESGVRLQHADLRSGLEAFREQRDDRGIDIVDGLAQCLDFRHGPGGFRMLFGLCRIDGGLLPVAMFGITHMCKTTPPNGHSVRRNR